MDTTSIAAMLYFTTLRIQTDLTTGTAFIFYHEWYSKKVSNVVSGYFLVTNKHVVPKTIEQLSFSFTAQAVDEYAPDFNQVIPVTLRGIHARQWFGHPSDEVDVTVFPLQMTLNKVSDKGQHPYITKITADNFPSEENLKALNAIEDILFIGYPNGIYDKENNLPIVRRGSTASFPIVDYNGEPKFLIDASVFPGSSGSPVFVYNAGSWIEDGAAVLGRERVIFLGVLSSVLYRETDGSVEFREIPATVETIVKTKEMIDLGVAYKARTIMEAVEDFLRRHGEI
ncbi:MAG: hypothetical protein OXC95_14220 [Dehalococcoidia bacterium]|nr:hypothetical protein [Dehalococcoidia bacterium]